MVRHTWFLKKRDLTGHWKAAHLDFSDVLMPAEARPGVKVHKSIEQDHGLDRSLDVELLKHSAPALERGEAVSFPMAVRNVHRTVGGMLAGEVSRRHGPGGLPADKHTYSLLADRRPRFNHFRPTPSGVLDGIYRNVKPADLMNSGR